MSAATRTAILGGAGILHTWGTDLVRAAAKAAGNFRIVEIDRLDEIGAAPTGDHVLYFSRFPSRSLVAAIERHEVGAIAFIEDAVETVAHQKRRSSEDLLGILRVQTASTVANAALRDHPAALIVRRDGPHHVDTLIEDILAHLGLSPAADALKPVIRRFGSSTTDPTNVPAGHTLEAALERCVKTYAPRNAPADVLSRDDATLAAQVLEPLLKLPTSSEEQPFVWPIGVFMSGDRPKEVAPLITAVTGGARIIYFGPYFQLPPGDYRIRFVMGTSKDIGRMSFTIEICGSEPIAKGHFETVPDGGIYSGSLDVSHRKPEEPLEFRLWSNEGAIQGEVALARVEFIRQPDQDPWWIEPPAS